VKLTDNSRDRWEALLNDGSVDGMVSPLCGDWCFSDTPYYWPYEEPDPFPPGHIHHFLGSQMAMGGVCGWDSLFVTAINFIPTDKTPVWTSQINQKSGSRNTITESIIETPYGDLTQMLENGAASQRILKHWLNERDDYNKLIWYLDNAWNIDLNAAYAEGQMLVKTVGKKGLIGTWVPPVYNQFGHSEEMFFHCMDWPDEYNAFLDASLRYTLKKLEIYANAGFDYIFYMIPGTEWVSPGFYDEYIRESSKIIINVWKSYGKKVMIHSCGQMKLFIEKGYFNELKPDIFETLSEPPVGNVPSLKWARDLLDSKIITKGNIGLDILLNGNADDVREAVYHVKEQTRGTRHVIGLSDCILNGTPLVNCLALTDESRKTL